MPWKDMLSGLVDEASIDAGFVTEIRLRTGQAALLVYADGCEVCGSIVSAKRLRAIVNRLMENSLYACEEELKQGYFTSVGGCRVGVCGKINANSYGVESLANIGSICIRIPRQMRGCALEIYEQTMKDGISSVLILSPPGLGKTTILRDLARLVSDAGSNVAIADERREIAACVEGVPTLDVGCRTDVMDGCRKEFALPMLIRACKPDMVVVDEIGAAKDAKVLEDAKRCGVAVAATAHAKDMRDALCRKHIARLLRSKVFDWCVSLGPEVGRIKSLRRCADERFDDAEGCASWSDSAVLHGGGENAVQRPQAQV